jgi:hypothetical protein
MSKKVKVDDDHYRIVTDDGRKSWLYEKDGSFDRCIEVAEHHPSGTTDAWEYDNGTIFNFLFNNSKGEKKNN